MTNDTLDSGAKLRAFLAVHKVTIAEMLPYLPVSRTWTSDVVNGEQPASERVRTAILAYLRDHRGLSVTEADLF